MFAARHEFLVYDLGGVVAAGIDVDALLDDRVRAGAQGLADLVATRLYLWAWFAGRAIIGVACGPVHCRGRGVGGVGRRSRRSRSNKRSRSRRRGSRTIDNGQGMGLVRLHFGMLFRGSETC